MITDEQIRDDLEQLLGFRPNAATLEALENNECLGAIRAGAPRALNQAADAVREMYGQIGVQLPQRESAPVLDRSRKTRLSSLRVEAVSVLIAAEAAHEKAVIAFRREVLRGKLIKPDRVEKWIENQQRKTETKYRWVRLNVANSEIEYDLVERPPRLRFKTPITEAVGEFGLPSRTVAYGVPGNDSTYLAASPGDGSLERLRLLSETLAKRYQWQPAQATLFVLTDAVPVISLSGYSYAMKDPLAASRITMTLDPILTPSEVAARYKEVRKQVLSSRYRSISEKHLELAIFMTDRLEGEPLKKSMEAWNRRFPEWGYSAPTNFGRDAASVRRRLLNPPVRFFPLGA